MAEDEGSPTATLTELRAEFDALVDIPVQMDFANFWQDLSREHAGDKIALTQLRQKLDDTEETGNTCHDTALREMKVLSQIASERFELLQTLQKGKSPYKGTFTQLPNGTAWYKHWLKSWLTSDVSPETLKAIALNDIAQARAKRKILDASSLPENSRTFAASDHAGIVAAFRTRERTVLKHLPNVIASEFQAPPVKIVPSTFPKSFPAPGVYNMMTNEFIYHLAGDTLPDRYMDWLFLHEAIPGHHYQFHFRTSNRACDLPPASQSTVLGEGWGAYTETLGSTLGLYTDKSSAAYALDWQEMRAVRVLIDIGIHYEGWSDDQARDVWMTYIPNQTDIMEREINRIHNWPVQVITYVFGKAVVQTFTEKKLSLNPDRPLAEIHAEFLAHPSAALFY
ncbi:DUF885 family protein [Kordiimonas sediminis]|nr:DUF885 family protein [Kordiimonas sediminis]